MSCSLGGLCFEQCTSHQIVRETDIESVVCFVCPKVLHVRFQELVKDLGQLGLSERLNLEDGSLHSDTKWQQMVEEAAQRVCMRFLGPGS